MKFLVAFGVLAVFVSLSWNAAAAPYFQSSGTSTTTINGVTVQSTTNNGKTEYLINGKPATEQEVQGILGGGNMGNMGINTGPVNIGNGMGMGMGMDHHNQMMEHHRKMMEQHNKMMEEHHKRIANMQNELANMGMGSIGNGMNIGGIGQTNTNAFEQQGNINQANWNFG